MKSAQWQIEREVGAPCCACGLGWHGMAGRGAGGRRAWQGMAGRWHGMAMGMAAGAWQQRGHGGALGRAPLPRSAHGWPRFSSASQTQLQTERLPQLPAPVCAQGDKGVQQAVAQGDKEAEKLEAARVSALRCRLLLPWQPIAAPDSPAWLRQSASQAGLAPAAAALRGAHCSSSRVRQQRPSQTTPAPPLHFLPQDERDPTYDPSKDTGE